MDNSSQILNKWLNTSGTAYHSVDVIIDDKTKKYDDESGPAHWPNSRFQHIVELRESALRKARDHWVDYIWVNRKLKITCIIMRYLLNCLKF